MAATTLLPPVNATTMLMNSTKWPTSDDDWEPHRARFRQLYLKEDKPLKDVMAIMQRDHGFKATVKMYQTRITKWKLDKRKKEHEMMAVVRQKRQRDAVGKASEFHVRGRVVSIDDVHRYLKRKGISIEDATALRATTPPDLRCCTPNGVPLSPVNPEIFDTPRRIFVSIRNYVLGSAESKIWLLAHDGRYYVKGKAEDSPAVDTFGECIFTACELLKGGSFQRAGKLLIKGSALIRDILLQEDPQLLVRLMDLLFLFRRSGQIGCGNIFLNQFSNMAAIVLPDMHPLRLIFGCLISLDPDLAEDVLTSGWESFMDIFEQEMGALSYSSLQNRLSYICSIGEVRGPDVAEGQLRAVVEKCKEAFGRFDVRYREAVFALADFLRYERRYADAATMALELIRCVNKETPWHQAAFWCHGMDVLAECQYENFDDESAESTLRQAIEVSSSVWGWHDVYTLRLLMRLEGCLKTFGKHEEAAEVSEQVAEIWRQTDDSV